MRDSTRNHIIQVLEEALQVTYSAPDREDYGYPYATGYCQSAMKIVLGMIREESK
jgi:hypothetical protein